MPSAYTKIKQLLIKHLAGTEFDVVSTDDDRNRCYDFHNCNGRMICIFHRDAQKPVTFCDGECHYPTALISIAETGDENLFELDRSVSCMYDSIMCDTVALGQPGFRQDDVAYSTKQLIEYINTNLSDDLTKLVDGCRKLARLRKSIKLANVSKMVYNEDLDEFVEEK